jgi:dTDP-4-amino-4,6-dideoxygalactose transaminase
MVVTQDSDRADKLKCLRSHGSKPKYHHKIIGGNFRLDALQAAIVTVKLKYLDQWTAARQRNAKTYSELLSDALAQLSDQSFPPVTIPPVKTDRHIFNQYVIRTSRRDQLQDWLKQKKIETEIYYPVPMHLQECFSYLGHKVGAFPESERAANETLALPIYPELSADQINYVVDSIRDFVSADSVSLGFRKHQT